MENKNISKFVFTDDEMAIKAEPYAVIECQKYEDFLYINALIEKDYLKPVPLRRESVSAVKKEFCTATCPHCKEILFMKNWAERAKWNLPKFCWECGQRLSWININSEVWTR